MGLFGRNKSKPPDRTSLDEIEASVQLVRRRLSNANMSLGDLFKLMGEDDRKILGSMARPQRDLTPEPVEERPQ